MSNSRSSALPSPTTSISRKSAGLFVLALLLLLLVIRPVLMGLLRAASGARDGRRQARRGWCRGRLTVGGAASPALIAAQQAAIARGEPPPQLIACAGHRLANRSRTNRRPGEGKLGEKGRRSGFRIIPMSLSRSCAAGCSKRTDDGYGQGTQKDQRGCQPYDRR